MRAPPWRTTGPALTPHRRAAVIRRLFIHKWTVNRVARWGGHSWRTIWKIYRMECERLGIMPVHKRHPPEYVMAMSAICPKCGGALDFRVEPGDGRTLEVCPGDPAEGLPGCGAWYMKQRYPT